MEPNVCGLDRLRLVEAPLVPEVRLHLAEDAIVWWARMEAQIGGVLTAPFWATAWPGGQAVARYLLDHPVTVAGRRVLDVASGSGLIAIAAGLAGAAAVTANDIDPYALAAITLNARANGVTVSTRPGDLLDGDGGDAEVILAGDVFRGHLPRNRMTTVAKYPAPEADSTEPYISQLSVLQPR